MIWRVELTKTAEKQLRKLDAPVRKTAIALFDRLQTLDDPRISGHGLTGPLAGYWTYRLHGDWRAIAEIRDGALVIVVLKIAARDSVYD